MSSTCKCPGVSRLQHIRPNSKIIHAIKSRVIILYDCPIQGCPFKCARKDLWGQHLQKNHNVAKPFECEKCGKSYRTSPNLLSHRCSDEPRGKFYCQPCNLWLNKIKRHKRTKKHEQNGKIIKGVNQVLLRSSLIINQLLQLISAYKYLL